MPFLIYLDPVLYALRGACLFFNVLLSAWLAVTVVLNARERNGPILFAGLSLLSGAIFFTLYAAGLTAPVRRVVLYLGGPAGAVTLLVLLFLPLAWFLVVLHYDGYGGPKVRGGTGGPEVSGSRRRWTTAIQLLIAVLLCLACIAAAGATLLELLQAKASNSIYYMYRLVRGAELRLFLFLFGLYVLASTGFAFQKLLQVPFAAAGVRGLARQKARRPMRRAGAMLLLLAWGVAGLVCLFFVTAHGRSRPSPLFWSVLFRFDGIAAAQVTFVIYYIGRAIISYEIFSGTVLPERSLQRQWKNAVSFTGCYALFGAVLFFVSFKAMLAGMAGGLVGVLFLVRLGWRLRSDRALHARTLRPFLGSQDLYGTVLRVTGAGLASDGDPDDPARRTFERFCLEVLESRHAALVPAGSSAALVTRPLMFRADPQPALSESDLANACVEVARRVMGRMNFDSFAGPARNFLALEPRDTGFIAAIPLWSGRRTVGVLLLGEKIRGGVYTLEEAEIAQAAGERLIDVLAAARLAQVLRELERARLAEMGLSDDRARRVLHDDILPEIHALMLRLNVREKETVDTLAGVHRRISSLLHEMPGAHPDLGEGLVPAVRGLSADPLGVDRLVLDIDEAAEEAASRLPAIKTEVLYFAVREAIRNATRYARRNGVPLEILIKLRAPAGLEITVEDNGPPEAPPRGDAEKNAGELSGITESIAAKGGGAGRGLALHGAMMAVIGGSLEFSRGGGGARVRLALDFE